MDGRRLGERRKWGLDYSRDSEKNALFRISIFLMERDIEGYNEEMSKIKCK